MCESPRVKVHDMILISVFSPATHTRECDSGGAGGQRGALPQGVLEPPPQGRHPLRLDHPHL